MRPERAFPGTFTARRFMPLRLARIARLPGLPLRVTAKTTFDPRVKPPPATLIWPPGCTLLPEQRVTHLAQLTRGFASAGAAQSRASADAVASVRKGRMPSGGRVSGRRAGGVT